jgi:hypothetical protein
MSKISARRHKPAIPSFSMRTIEMMKSPSFKVLSRAGRQVLDRIEIEHAHHGGKDNGSLPVTFDQFEEYGVHRHAIAPAIREDTALGFVEVTQEGRAGNAEWRRPTLFRLTYRDTPDLKATNDWRKITETDAEMIANGARQKQNPSGGKRTEAWCGKRTESQCGKRTTNSKNPRKFHSAETATTSRYTLHLKGRGSQGQQPSPPDPADAALLSPASPDPEPEADLDIPEFLRRGSR